MDGKDILGSETSKKYKNGNIYKGNTKNLTAEGAGKLIFLNGNTFEGEFKDDKIKPYSKGQISGKF